MPTLILSYMHNEQPQGDAVITNKKKSILLGRLPSSISVFFLSKRPLLVHDKLEGTTHEW